MAKTTNENTKKELNLDTKVTVRSISTWPITFPRRADGAGTNVGVSIPPLGATRISRNEIIMQIQSGNKLLGGIDGQGNHASLIIEDNSTRVEVGFESEDGTHKAFVLTNDIVKELFDIRSQQEFENKVKDSIITRDEKDYIIQAIRDLGLNDYNKIRYIEKYVEREVM